MKNQNLFSDLNRILSRLSLILIISFISGCAVLEVNKIGVEHCTVTKVLDVKRISRQYIGRTENHCLGLNKSGWFSIDIKDMAPIPPSGIKNYPNPKFKHRIGNAPAVFFSDQAVEQEILYTFPDRKQDLLSPVFFDAKDYHLFVMTCNGKEEKCHSVTLDKFFKKRDPIKRAFAMFLYPPAIVLDTLIGITLLPLGAYCLVGDCSIRIVG